MSIEKVVVVEDELALRMSLEAHLRQRRCDVLAVSNLAAAREALAKDTFDLVLLDVLLPNGEEGTDLLKELQQRPQRPLVVIMTAAASVESAVDCMRNGAFDYLTKPFSFNQIDILLKKADEFSRIVRVNQFLSKETDADWELLGGSHAIEQLRLSIRQVARTQATVLIQGESGTGKELVARALHKESPRASAPLIKVNCAAIPDNLIESEFFGHEKGAFTGALNKREGRFELAHGGTILLDEISEIAPVPPFRSGFQCRPWAGERGFAFARPSEAVRLLSREITSSLSSRRDRGRFSFQRKASRSAPCRPRARSTDSPPPDETRCDQRDS